MKDNLCGFVNHETPKVCCPDGGEVTPSEDDIRSHHNFQLLPTECGPIAHGTRITDGIAASPGEFPWMALVAYKTGTVN
jgi:hypothetical protein